MITKAELEARIDSQTNTLNLRKMRLDDSHAELIATVLQANPTVTAINLSDNNITQLTLETLTHVAADSLQGLYLGKMNLDDQIADAIVKFSQLEILDLTDTDVTDTGIIAILQQAPQLTTLKLDNNSLITNATLAAVAQHRTLRYFSINSSSITPTGATVFINNTRLLDLNIVCDGMSPEEQQAIEKQIANNRETQERERATKYTGTFLASPTRETKKRKEPTLALPNTLNDTDGFRTPTKQLKASSSNTTTPTKPNSTDNSFSESPEKPNPFGPTALFN